MVPYQPPAFRPRMAQVVVPAVTPVVSTPSGVAFPEGLFWTALAGAASVAGISTGMREKGLLSVIGWAGGIAAGLAALTGLTGVVAPTAARSLPLRWYFTA